MMGHEFKFCPICGADRCTCGYMWIDPDPTLVDALEMMDSMDDEEGE